MTTTPTAILGRLRRGAAALRDPRTRPDAVRRIRRRAARALHQTPAPPPKQAAKQAAAANAAAKKPAPKKPVAPARVDPAYAGAWARLARTVLDDPDLVAPRRELDPDTAAAADAALLAARRQRTHAHLAEALAEGAGPERAVLATVEALVGVKDWHAAWAVAEGAGRWPGGERAAALGHGLLRHRQRQLARGWDVLAALEDAELAEFAPVEAVDGALAADTDASRKRARSIAAPGAAFTAAVLVDLAGRFLAFGERDLAGRLMAELAARPATEVEALDERRARSRALIGVWLARRPRTVPTGSVPIAVVDYQSPDQDLTSGNLGDYVQTLALLGNLVRRGDVTFTGEDGLGELATELQARVRPELRLDGPGAAVHLLDVNREFTSGDDIPDGTWMIAFGWHMHPLYDLRYDFPYHPSIRPLFASFHLNRLDMLTDDALSYLRRYGPVGCRDWSTVFLLLSAGVDAFFTGCLTTTVNTLFPTREDVYGGDGVVGVIDLRKAAAGTVSRPVRVYSHQSDEYRHMSLVDGVHAAADALAGYQAGLAYAVTRRLHAYLPLVSLGVPVDFAPWSPGDVRFNGLDGLEPGSPALTEIQDGIRELVAQTMDVVLSGADEPAVYERWRTVTADRVVAAKAAFAETVDDPPTTIDVEAAVAACTAGRTRTGPHEAVDADTVTDIVLCYDQNLADQAGVLVESMLANASGPLRLTVLGRGLGPAYRDWFAAAFPALPATFVPCEHVDYGPIERIPARITISTMDRLLLPHLLGDVERVVYLDIDTIVLDDVCALAGIDLGGAPYAARDSNVSEASEWRAAARRLPGERALELQRRMGHAHGYGSAALNAGVLVLDLDRMRRDDFTRLALGWVERYGLHDQDILLGYGGPGRCVLDPRWNTLPVHEDVVDPAVIHWASLAKPWDAQLTYAADRWRHYAARLRERAPLAPSG